MNNITFDCSLFQANDPELAKKVDKVCREFVGFPDLSNIRIPWAQAKAFAEKRGKLYQKMKDWKDYMSNSFKYSYRNTHIYEFSKALSSQSSFNKFYYKLGVIVAGFQKAEQPKAMWRVKYGTIGG